MERFQGGKASFRSTQPPTKRECCAFNGGAMACPNIKVSPPGLAQQFRCRVMERRQVKE